MKELPPVSCMCLTYGRPHVLEEAIESFLRQDYAGEKELLILNDLEDQELVFDHPEVRVINVSKRFRTVGEKRNACAALCSHDLLFVWDDDDIYFPWRISYSVEMFDTDKMFFKPSRAFMLDNGVISGPHSNLFHSASCWDRKLFNLVRGYAHMGSGQDFELEDLMRQAHVKSNMSFDQIPAEKIYYLYRWGGTGSFHLSSFGQDQADQMTGNDKVGDYIADQILQGVLDSGTIVLEPQWGHDYLAKVRTFYEANQSKSSAN